MFQTHFPETNYVTGQRHSNSWNKLPKMQHIKALPRYFRYHWWRKKTETKQKGTEGGNTQPLKELETRTMENKIKAGNFEQRFQKNEVTA